MDLAELARLARLADPSLFPQARILCGFWAGPQTCMANTWPTEPSPQPLTVVSIDIFCLFNSFISDLGRNKEQVSTWLADQRRMEAIGDMLWGRIESQTCIEYLQKDCQTTACIWICLITSSCKQGNLVTSIYAHPQMLHNITKTWWMWQTDLQSRKYLLFCSFLGNIFYFLSYEKETNLTKYLIPTSIRYLHPSNYKTKYTARNWRPMIFFYIKKAGSYFLSSELNMTALWWTRWAEVISVSPEKRVLSSGDQPWPHSEIPSTLRDISGKSGGSLLNTAHAWVSQVPRVTVVCRSDRHSYSADVRQVHT